LCSDKGEETVICFSAMRHGEWTINNRGIGADSAEVENLKARASLKADPLESAAFFKAVVLDDFNTSRNHNFPNSGSSKGMSFNFPKIGSAFE
jgi:hypothetical protein